MLDRAKFTEAQLTTFEAEMLCLTKLKEDKGLVEIKKERFTELTQHGIIAVGCPDGDHSHDVFVHLSAYNRRLHLLALNGGGMLISPQNPAFDFDGGSLVRNISAAWAMGKGQSVLVFSHWPCGRAREDRIPVQEVICQTLEADKVITAVLGVSSDVVVPLFHVDWTPFERDADKKKRRTYVIKNGARQMLSK